MSRSWIPAAGAPTNSWTRGSSPLPATVPTAAPAALPNRSTSIPPMTAMRRARSMVAATAHMSRAPPPGSTVRCWPERPAFGVARDARIISINVFHQSGSGLLASHSNQIKGLERVLRAAQHAQDRGGQHEPGGWEQCCPLRYGMYASRSSISCAPRGIATRAAGRQFQVETAGSARRLHFSSAIAVASSTKADAPLDLLRLGRSDQISFSAPAPTLGNASPVTNGQQVTPLLPCTTARPWRHPHVARRFYAPRCVPRWPAPPP